MSFASVILEVSADVTQAEAVLQAAEAAIEEMAPEPAHEPIVVKTDDGHECIVCDDEWARTRAADSVAAVRWAGWLS